MGISFQHSLNLLSAAELTYQNMETYYRKYSVGWDPQLIRSKTENLENYDILDGQTLLGVIRFQFENEFCYIRDIQIYAAHRNKGVGATVLEMAKCYALEKNVSTIKLRVFKISPAVRLYERNGYKIINEDDRFYCMELIVP